MSEEDPNVHPRWAAETKAIAARLHEMDYFQVLEVTQGASFEELKRAYHHLQRNYHPDSFFTSPDHALRNAVHLIAKRVTEAYVILKDPNRRAKYTRDIAGPHREERLRYTEDSEREVRKEKEEAIAKTPQARQLWVKAQAAMRKGDNTAAEKDLKMALIFEPGNERIKAQLELLQAIPENEK